MNNRLLIAFLIVLTGIAYGQKINESKLETLLKKAEETHSESILIYQNHQLVTEKYFGIGTPDAKIESMSCTKSIVGLAVACLITDRLITSLDTPVADFYPEWKQGQKQFITLRHLVNMTSGMQNNPNASVEIYPSDNFVQLALASELSKKPGEAWEYNNKSLNLMAGIIKKITGKRMDDYIGERLFLPLQITDFTWTLDNAGNPHVMSGCQIKPRDLIKLGILLLNKGNYNGNQVIAEDHIADVVNPSAQFKGYGMLWWLDYETTISVVDNDIIKDLRKANVSKDFIRKAIKMKGTYNSNEDYLKRLQLVFGNNPYDYISQHLKPGLRLRKREFGGTVTYRADGYLGNYIIVNPKDNLVAVRMISHQSYQSQEDGFSDFGKQIIGLTQ